MKVLRSLAGQTQPIRLISLISLSIVASLAGTGCDLLETPGRGADQACTPGRAETCACPDGAQSSQICADDGSRFEDCACDYIGNDMGQTTYIVGGEQSREFAATGSLSIAGFLCTATLVAPDVVLTAAHCVFGRTAAEVTFGIGMSANSSAIFRQVASITVHPDYIPFDVNNQASFVNGKDLAILRLVEAINEIQPASLFLGDVSAFANQTLRLVGYGATEVISTPLELQAVGSGVRRSATVVLDGLQGETLFYNFMGMGSCNGDSGGPAFVELTSGNWQQVGVTSFGDTRCSSRGFYQRLDLHADWIRSVAGNVEGRTASCENDLVCDGLCAFDEDCVDLLCPGGSCPADDGNCANDGVCDRLCGNVDPDCGGGGGGDPTDPCLAYGLHGNGVCDPQCPRDPECTDTSSPGTCNPAFTQVSGNQCVYVSVGGQVCGSFPLAGLVFDRATASCVAIDTAGTACGAAPASATFDPFSGVCTYLDPLGRPCGQSYAFCGPLGCQC